MQKLFNSIRTIHHHIVCDPSADDTTLGKVFTYQLIQTSYKGRSVTFVASNPARMFTSSEEPLQGMWATHPGDVIVGNPHNTKGSP